jgi:hypothetical protein
LKNRKQAAFYPAAIGVQEAGCLLSGSYWSSGKRSLVNDLLLKFSDRANTVLVKIHFFEFIPR